MSVLDRRNIIDPGNDLPIQPEQVLVAVPTLNEARHIERCLRSLMESDPFCDRVLFAVADGGSTDETRTIVEALTQTHSNLVLLDNPDVLQSAGINRVVAELAGPDHVILVRCDAHAKYPSGYVRRIVDAFANHPDAASVAGVLDARGDNGFQQASAWAVDTRLGSGGSAHRGGTRSGWVDHGHHAGFRLEWFRRLGGYDPGFSHNEDAEYDHRLAQADGRLWLEGQLRTDYVMRPTPSALWIQYWHYGKGRARTVMKHRMRPRARQIAPALLLVLQLCCLVAAPFWPPALGLPALYLAMLAAVSVVAAVRMQSVCGLWAGVALFIIHNAWGAGFIRGLIQGSARGAGRQ